MPPVTTGGMNKPYKGFKLAEPEGSLKGLPTAAFSQADAKAACFFMPWYSHSSLSICPISAFIFP